MGMHVKLGKKTLKAVWVHHATPTFYRIGEDELRSSHAVHTQIGKNVVDRSAVSCVLFYGKVQVVGTSFTHPRDVSVFSPDRGRQQALAKALKVLELNRRSRQKVWNTYLGFTEDKRIHGEWPTVSARHSYGRLVPNA
jgi:hypothetical protein